MEFEFKIFTLNCWGIWGISKDRKPRMKAIAEVLAQKDYDIVCLQEVWTNEDFFLIRDKVVDVLPYCHYFYSGVMGSGICIFSKHPIQETFFHQWPLNGYIHKLHHGDWFGGKGVGLCKIAFNQFTINIYSAHLHAEYNRKNDEYEAHRILQAYDTAQFISLTSENADLVVLAGDLNTEPGDLAYRIILTMPGLVDAFKDDGLSSNLVATCESLRNSYTPIAQIKKKKEGQRIDHILYHPGSRMQAELKSYCQPLPDRVPNHSYSYSDHEAIESTFVITSRKKSPTFVSTEEKKCVLENCVSILTKALDRLVSHQIFYSVFAIVLLSLLLLSFAFTSPFGYVIIFNILRIFIVVLILFCTIMATIWNKIEKHGILAAKLVIEINLKQCCKDL